MQVGDVLRNEQAERDPFFYEIHFEDDASRFWAIRVYLLLCQHFGHDGWARWYDVLVTDVEWRDGLMD